MIRWLRARVMAFVPRTMTLSGRCVRAASLSAGKSRCTVGSPPLMCSCRNGMVSSRARMVENRSRDMFSPWAPSAKMQKSQDRLHFVVILIFAVFRTRG